MQIGVSKASPRALYVFAEDVQSGLHPMQVYRSANAGATRS